MYSDRWSPGLRQGDIVGTIWLPMVDAQFAFVAESRSLVTPTAEPTLKHVLVGAKECLVVVVSHDCEFNEDKRNKLLVARLQRCPGNLDADDRAELRASNDVKARSEAELPVHGVDCWVFDPLPGVFDEQQIVSFTTITALPMSMRADLRAQKRAELLHEDRVRLRKKLAWFLSRDGEDISDEEKGPAGSDVPSEAT